MLLCGVQFTSLQPDNQPARHNNNGKSVTRVICHNYECKVSIIQEFGQCPQTLPLLFFRGSGLDSHRLFFTDKIHGLCSYDPWFV
jgi:hypothetical protein